MTNQAKICPFMSSKMNYQYCIDECNFYDEYVGCLIKYDLQEVSNTAYRTESLIRLVLEKL